MPVPNVAFQIFDDSVERTSSTKKSEVHPSQTRRLYSPSRPVVEMLAPLCIYLANKARCLLYSDWGTGGHERRRKRMAQKGRRVSTEHRPVQTVVHPDRQGKL